MVSKRSKEIEIYLACKESKRTGLNKQLDLANNSNEQLTSKVKQAEEDACKSEKLLRLDIKELEDKLEQAMSKVKCLSDNVLQGQLKESVKNREEWSVEKTTLERKVNFLGQKIMEYNVKFNDICTQLSERKESINKNMSVIETLTKQNHVLGKAGILEQEKTFVLSSKLSDAKNSIDQLTMEVASMR